MDREVEIDKGSNKHLEWSETLYEDDEHITYLECGLGEVLKTMPGIDEDIEYIVKIKKEDLGDMTFDKLVFVLKNLDSNLKFNHFCSFLKRKKIKFDEQIW
jgi:hypothetical protein|tara:strand:+ start:436 stop:738 length:303 start_codon:yes stop_codon:yes gene_type:complete